jgi:hypothetical protein
MISIEDTKLGKLAAATDAELSAILGGTLLPDEQPTLAFTASGESVVFTTRRVLVILPLGLTGKKREVNSIQLAHVSAFSVETNEARDEVSAITIVARGVGRVIFELRDAIPMAQFNQLVASRIGL